MRLLLIVAVLLGVAAAIGKRESKREMATEVAAPPEHPPHDSEDASVPSKREARQADTTEGCVTDPKEINCRNSPPGECKWKLCGKDKRETAAAAEVAATKPLEQILLAKREAEQRDGFPGPFPTRPGKRDSGSWPPYDLPDACPDGPLCFKNRRDAETAAAGAMAKREVEQRDGFPGPFPTRPGKREAGSWPPHGWDEQYRCRPGRPGCRSRDASTGPGKREVEQRDGFPSRFPTGPGKREAGEKYRCYSGYPRICRPAFPRKAVGPGKREVASRPPGMLCPKGENCPDFKHRRETSESAAAAGPGKREAECRGGWACTFKPGKRSVEAALKAANRIPAL